MTLHCICHCGFGQLRSLHWKFSAQPPKVKEPQSNISHKVGEGLSFPKTSVLDSFITPAMCLGTSSIISSTPIPSFFSLLLWEQGVPYLTLYPHLHFWSIVLWFTYNRQFFFFFPEKICFLFGDQRRNSPPAQGAGALKNGMRVPIQALPKCSRWGEESHHRQLMQWK